VTVIPLRNLTGDADQHYFAEAFTDHLVTDLLRCCRGLSLALSPDKRDAVRNLAPAEAPDLEHVVAGSAQHSRPGMLRVNMRISDGATAEYLWAGRYEFHPEDLANIRTEITRQICRELHILLLEAVSLRAFINSGAEFGVNECLSRAATALQGQMQAEITAEAQQWFLAALARDPCNTEALVGLARTCQQLVSNPWWGDPCAGAAASDLGREAIAISLELVPGRAARDQ